MICIPAWLRVRVRVRVRVVRVRVRVMVLLFLILIYSVIHSRVMQCTSNDSMVCLLVL